MIEVRPEGGKTPFPRRIPRVNRLARERRISLYLACTMSRARFACKSREMLRTIALTGLAALLAATTVSYTHLTLPTNREV